MPAAGGAEASMLVLSRVGAAGEAAVAGVAESIQSQLAKWQNERPFKEAYFASQRRILTEIQTNVGEIEKWELPVAKAFPSAGQAKTPFPGAVSFSGAASMGQAGDASSVGFVPLDSQFSLTSQGLGGASVDAMGGDSTFGDIGGSLGISRIGGGGGEEKRGNETMQASMQGDAGTATAEAAN